MSLIAFVRNALADYRSTAAVVPSSRRLARAMVAPLRGKTRQVVIEFGPGTGVITRELLRVMPPDGILLAFEISPRFVAYLRETIMDERLYVVHAGAETASDECRRRGIDGVDAVVSSLGVALMAAEEVDAIFRPLIAYLREDGTITQFQYVSRIRFADGRVEYFDAGRFLERYFSSVRSTRVWSNIPPAFVITCKDARSNAAGPDRAW